MSSTPSSEIANVAIFPEPRFEHIGIVPVALGILRQMKVAEFIDECAPPKVPGPQHTLARSLGQAQPLQGPSSGQCIEAMVVSILEAGRVTLYAMEDWIRNLPVQDYWGEQVLSNHFTDDRLADTLDVVWDIGLDSTFTRIMGHSMVRYGLTAERLHSDGSTIAVQGAYDLPDDTVGPIPLRGFSKDNKRDCKQLVVGATVQQDGIPLAFSFYDGNTTDQPIYREHMERIADAMRGSKNTTFIADCKLCDRYCLGALHVQGMDTITLLPRSHANHASTLDAALNLPIDQWHIIEQRPSRSSDEPTIFRGVVVPIDMQLSVPNGVDSEGQRLFESKTVQWSALVVHSSQLAQNHEAELQSKWDKASTTAEKQARTVSKLQFETQSAAQEALTLFIKDTRCPGATVHGKVVEELIRTPRGRGRPRRRSSPIDNANEASMAY